MQKYSTLLPWAISQSTRRTQHIHTHIFQGIQHTVRYFPSTHTHPGDTRSGRDRKPAFLTRRARPIGREQLGDPLLQTRAVKEVRSPLSEVCLHGRAPIFLRGHTLPLFHLRYGIVLLVFPGLATARVCLPASSPHSPLSYYMPCYY